MRIDATKERIWRDLIRLWINHGTSFNDIYHCLTMIKREMRGMQFPSEIIMEELKHI